MCVRSYIRLQEGVSVQLKQQDTCFVFQYSYRSFLLYHRRHISAWLLHMYTGNGFRLYASVNFLTQITERRNNVLETKKIVFKYNIDKTYVSNQSPDRSVTVITILASEFRLGDPVSSDITTTLNRFLFSGSSFFNVTSPRLLCILKNSASGIFFSRYVTCAPILKDMVVRQI